MTQCERLTRHLNEVGPITAAEAVSEYGIYRLSARIAELKAEGLQITKDSVASKNRYGETVYFARYRLES